MTGDAIAGFYGWLCYISNLIFKLIAIYYLRIKSLPKPNDIFWAFLRNSYNGWSFISSEQVEVDLVRPKRILFYCYNSLQID